MQGVGFGRGVGVQGMAGFGQGVGRRVGRGVRRWARSVAALGVTVVVAGCGGGGSHGGAAAAKGSPARSQQAAVPPTPGATVYFAAAPGTSQDELNRDVSIIQRRIASAKLTDTTVSVIRGGLEVRGPASERSRVEMLGYTGALGFRPVLATGAANSAGGSRPPGVSAALWQQYESLDCKKAPVPEEATAQITACERDGSQKYILDATAVDGASVTSADASLDSSSASWQVAVSLNSEGAARFGQLTGRLAGTGGQVAIAMDGVVYSAPTIQSAITGGDLEITGKFDRDTAQSLAATLKSGTLPAPLTLSKTALPTG